MTFAVVIIIAVYLPILFLQGLEGRMFRPMAITVCTALFGSLLLALMLVPALASFAFRRGVSPKGGRLGTHAWLARATDRYGRALEWGIHHRFTTIGVAAAV